MLMLVDVDVDIFHRFMGHDFPKTYQEQTRAFDCFECFGPSNAQGALACGTTSVVMAPQNRWVGEPQSQLELGYAQGGSDEAFYFSASETWGQSDPFLEIDASFIQFPY